MRRTIILVICMVTFGQLMVESYHIFWWVMGDKALKNINLFVDQTAVPDGQNILWYVKDLSETLKSGIWVFCFSLIAGKVSGRLMWVGFTWSLYYVFDCIMYMYDYRRGYGSYAIVTIAVVVSSLLIFKREKPGAKIIEL